MFFPPSPYPFSNFLVVSILQWFTGKENPYKTLIFFTKDRKEARIEKKRKKPVLFTGNTMHFLKKKAGFISSSVRNSTSGIHFDGIWKKSQDCSFSFRYSAYSSTILHELLVPISSTPISSMRRQAERTNCLGTPESLSLVLPETLAFITLS